MTNTSAKEMADFIERWLGSPISRKVLEFCTKRCRCGRRIELALNNYIGKKGEMCFNCRTASFIVKKILDSIIARTDIDRKEITASLKDSMWRKGLASVLEGIGKYGVRKPFTAYSPFLIVWDLTKACNLNCKHCYQNARIPAADELNEKEALEAVDKMAEAGIAYIALSGGEPLMRRDFFSIVKRIRDNDMAVSIATNGTLLTRDRIEKMEKLGVSYIQISLDGARAKTHDSFRGKNIFRKTIQGIKNAVKSNITIGIATTVTKYNMKEVPAIINFAEKLGVDIFMYYNFVPTCRGKDIMNMDISPKEREDILSSMANQIGERDLSLLATAPQYGRICSAFSRLSLTHFDTFGQKEDTETGFLAEFIGGCGAGRLYCALEPNGDIYPCVFIPIKLGNIKEDDFLEVWHNSSVLKKIRDRANFKGHCRVCENRNICGGCRARAYAYFDDIQGPDPGCIFNQKEWNKVKPISK